MAEPPFPRKRFSTNGAPFIQTLRRLRKKWLPFRKPLMTWKTGTEESRSIRVTLIELPGVTHIGMLSDATVQDDISTILATPCP